MVTSSPAILPERIERRILLIRGQKGDAKHERIFVHVQDGIVGNEGRGRVDLEEPRSAVGRNCEPSHEKGDRGWIALPGR